MTAYRFLNGAFLHGAFALALSLALISCTEKIVDDSGSSGGAGFNRTAMLTNYADHLILPAYAELQVRCNTLNAAAQAFTAAPDINTLTALQTSWDAAALSWQSANAFNFGPANLPTVGLLSRAVGTFPVSADGIETLIDTESLNFDNYAYTTRGFLGMEYLIFNAAGNAAVLARYTSDGNQAKRKAYLNAVAFDLKAKVDAVVAAWNGSYRAEFIGNAGTDVSGSVTQLFNAFVLSYEDLKNFKVSLPLGKRPAQTAPEPNKVEAYYSGRSLVFLKAHLAAIEHIWLGRTKAGNDSLGFDNYLQSVPGGDALMASTKAQLAAAKAAVNSLPDTVPLASTMQGNGAEVNAAYTELQKLTRYLKSDLGSLLGLTITYNSSDGD